MVDSLKVLMVGGSRVGKTSVLAGLLNAMLNGEVQNYLKIEDVTANSNQESLQAKIKALSTEVQKKKGKVFLVDDSKTDAFTTHTIKFQIPGTQNQMTVEFKDVNGEFYEQSAQHNVGEGQLISHAEVVNAVKEADIYIVAIDTTYLMEACNPDNTLCSEVVNSAFNHIGDVHNFLTNIDDKQGADAKLVLFVPIKCEKWAHCGQLDQVADRIEKCYAVTLKALRQYTNIEIDILPVQTVGAIEFKEHREALICTQGQSVGKKCCLIEESKELRFPDGSKRKIEPDDAFDDDPDSAISSLHSIMRPYSWFHVTGDRYSPRNCEQLAYYILKFVLGKYRFAKEAEERKKEEGKRKNMKLFGLIFAAVVAVWSLSLALLGAIFIQWKAKMGTMSFEQLNNLISTFESQHLIKRNVEGIRNIKKSLLDD